MVIVQVSFSFSAENITAKHTHLVVEGLQIASVVWCVRVGDVNVATMWGGGWGKAVNIHCR